MADLLQRPENFEREIIHDPAEPPPEPAQFPELMNEFFQACGNRYTASTHWIIELQKVHPNGTLKDVVAIGKNKGFGGDHVEVVFTKWWPSYVERLNREGYTCRLLKVYTNYTSCAECAPVLSEWLNDHIDVEMSIFYAFVYIGPRFGTDEEHVAGWQQLRNTENLVEIQDFDSPSLRELANRVNYQEEAIADGHIPWHPNEERKAEVNKARINRNA